MGFDAAVAGQIAATRQPGVADQSGTLIDEFTCDPSLLDPRLQETLSAIFLDDIYVDDDKVRLETFFERAFEILLLFRNGTADRCGIERVEEWQCVLRSRRWEMGMVWFRCEASGSEVNIVECGIVGGGRIGTQCDEDTLGEKVAICIGS